MAVIAACTAVVSLVLPLPAAPQTMGVGCTPPKSAIQQPVPLFGFTCRPLSPEPLFRGHAEVESTYRAAPPSPADVKPLRLTIVPATSPEIDNAFRDVFELTGGGATDEP